MARSGKAPDPAVLREAARVHLARYPTTRAGLLRVLLRRIARWARVAEGEREAIVAATAAARAAARAVVDQLAETDHLDDTAFAVARARRLARSGTSRRGIAAHLVRHGLVGTELAAALADDPATELTSALAFTRKRHIGPFRADPLSDPAGRRRELAALARAGYPAAIARTALAMPRAEAEERLLAARRSAD